MEANSVEAVPALALQRVDDVDPPATGEMRRRRCLVERDRFRRRRPVAQLHAEMAAIRAERLGSHHLYLPAEEQGLAIPDAKGRERLDLLVQAWLEVGEGRRRLDRDRPREGVAVQARRRVVLEAFLELGKAILEDGEPGR